MPSPELFVRDLRCPGGLAFDVDAELFVAETRAGVIRKISPEGRIHPFVSTGGQPTGLAFDDSEDLFVAQRDRHQILLVSLDQDIAVYLHQARGRHFIGPRDLYFGPQGVLYFSDAGHSSATDPCGSIYAVDVKGVATQVAAGLAHPGGLVISADGTSLFAAETGRNRIVSMEIDEEGRLGEPQVFMRFEDGAGPRALLLDTAGTLYIGRAGAGLTLADGEGRILDQVALPGDEPTGMTFGGDNFDELYIAEAQTGAIYRLQIQPAGQRPFAGPRSV